MFAKILVPLDGSEHSLKALDYAIGVARKFSSVVHIVHIVHIVQAVSAATYDTAFMMRGLYTRASDMAGPSFMIDLKNHLEENGRRILATTETKTREAGIKAVTTLLYGSPAEEIINFAEKEEMDSWDRPPIFESYLRDIERDDPLLVEVVEKLGDQSSGKLSSLKIVEIPADVDFVIEEYDGLEWVAERHRTWH